MQLCLKCECHDHLFVSKILNVKMPHSLTGILRYHVTVTHLVDGFSKCSDELLSVDIVNKCIISLVCVMKNTFYMFDSEYWNLDTFFIDKIKHL